MEFAKTVLRVAAGLMATPSFSIPCASLALASEAIVLVSGWPGADAGELPTPQALTTIILVILGRAWLLLSFAALALAKLRGQRATLLTAWVPVTTALEILIVSIALGAGVILGTLALIVPGVYLLLLWSQAAMVIVDREARFFRAASWSGSLTDGYRREIAVVWAIVFGGSWVIDLEIRSLAASFAGLSTAAGLALLWIWRALTMTFGVAMMAALYHELSCRAPWQPELERLRPGADARIAETMRRAKDAATPEPVSADGAWH